jgi:hypothetical protein
MYHLDSWFKSYEVLKISVAVRACCQPLPMQQNLPKSDQNCPKLPKFAKICPKIISLKNFDMPPKIEILGFFKIKISMCRGGTRACFYHSNFQSKNFLYFGQKTAFVYEFQHTPLWKLMIFSRFHTSYGHEILWTCT